MQSRRRALVLATSFVLANSLSAKAQSVLPESRGRLDVARGRIRRLQDAIDEISNSAPLQTPIDILAQNPGLAADDASIRLEIDSLLRVLAPTERRELALAEFQTLTIALSETENLIRPIAEIVPASQQRGIRNSGSRRRTDAIVELLLTLLGLDEIADRIIQFFRAHSIVGPLLLDIERAIGSDSARQLQAAVSALLTYLLTRGMEELLRLVLNVGGQSLQRRMLQRLAVRFIPFVGPAMLAIDLMLLVRRLAPDLFAR